MDRSSFVFDFFFLCDEEVKVGVEKRMHFIVHRCGCGHFFSLFHLFGCWVLWV